MGNFYCNFSIRGSDQEAIVSALRSARRRALVTPTTRNTTIVYDAATDDLDEVEIDAVGNLLSTQISAPVLAAVVIDDDELCLRLYEGGLMLVDYSSRRRFRGAYAICRAFGRPFAVPFAGLLLHIPYVVFETLRHMALAKALGIPRSCVGIGYRNIAEDDLPFDMNVEELVSTH